ncbi:MAG: HEAT repeat domain-containing protein, partial [Pyrinomonadaceae bacterium]
GLLAALAGRNDERRERAREAFIKHDYFDEATKDLRTAKADAERASAARSLGLARDTSATPHLVAALEDSSPEVRRAAVEALADLRDPEALAPLQSLLEREKDRKVPRGLIRRAIEASAPAVAAVEETPTAEAAPVVAETEEVTAETVRPPSVETSEAPSVETAVQPDALDTVPEPKTIETGASPVADLSSAETTGDAGTLAAATPIVIAGAAGLADMAARRRAEKEEERRRAEEEATARKRAEEEEAQRRAEEARQRAEEERQRAEEEAARQRAAEEEARQRAEAEATARKRAEEEARARAEEERQRAEAEARRQAEEETRRRAEEEAARKRAEEEAARIKAEEEAKARAEEERKRAEAEATARQRAEDEARRAEEARQRAEEEARQRAEAERRQAEEEARRAEEARLRAEEEARQRAEAERQRAEDEAARQRLEAEAARRRAEEEAERQRGEAELARLRAEAEATRLRSEEELARRQVIQPDVASSLVDQGEVKEIAPSETASFDGVPEPLIERNDGTAAGWIEVDISEPEIVRHATPIKQSPAAPVEEEKSIAHVPSEPVMAEPMPEPTAFQPPVEALAPEVVEQPSATKEIDAAISDKGIAPVGEDLSTVPSAILKRLSSEDDNERATAVADLGRLGGDDSFREITAAFDDPSQGVRDAAARSLYNLQADRAASFTRALREAPPERRRAIGAALASSGLANEAIGHLMGESREKTYDAFSLLFLMSKAGEVQPLLRAIEDHPNNEVRLAVVKLLALSGQQEILPAFRRLAVRGSLPTEVRSAVMEAIYQISSQSSPDASSAA